MTLQLIKGVVIMMSHLDDFITIICGNFDNSQQVQELKEQGREDYPSAKHVNHVCNDKIQNLPDEFQGKFVLEESYYTIQGKTRPEPRIFLFTEQGEDVLLTSYELPKTIDANTLTYETMPTIAYEDLKISAKFTPAVFRKEGNEWVGGSTSHFSPTLTFILSERFSPEQLIVSEVMESNGNRTFGFDPPISYKRI